VIATIPDFFTNPARACAQPGVDADWFFVETSVPVAETPGLTEGIEP